MIFRVFKVSQTFDQNMNNIIYHSEPMNRYCSPNANVTVVNQTSVPLENHSDKKMPDLANQEEEKMPGLCCMDDNSSLPVKMNMPGYEWFDHCNVLVKLQSPTGRIFLLVA